LESPQLNPLRPSLPSVQSAIESKNAQED
jgi:hypothetical protein